jgi:hypothetical protein
MLMSILVILAFDSIRETICQLSSLTKAPYSLNDYMFNVAENGLFMMVRPHAEEEYVVVTWEGGKVPLKLREHESYLMETDLGVVIEL